MYNNAELENTIAVLNNITTVPAFPVLWIDEGADIDQVGTSVQTWVMSSSSGS